MITFDDVKVVLNIQDSARKFQPASIPQSLRDAVVANASAVVRAHTPSNYLPLLTGVSGYVFTREAAGGEQTFSLPAVLTRYTGKGKIWVDYRGVWGDRRDSSAVAATWTATTVTLAAPLSSGQSVVGEWEHDAYALPLIIKRFALDVAVNDLLAAMPTYQVDPAVRQMYADRYQQVREDLRRYSKGELRVHEWDALPLVADRETVTKRGQGVLHIGW